MKTQTSLVAMVAAERAAKKSATVAATLANLPSDLGRNRVLDAAASSAFWGVSLPHWRRLIAPERSPGRSRLASASSGGALALSPTLSPLATARRRMLALGKGGYTDAPSSPLIPLRAE